MGAWSVSITGNDTAQDLKSEYQAAFYYNEVEVALKKIDDYIRSIMDENDEGEWCDYYYSLANFMWDKGILTEEIKERVLKMIDTGFGLSVWEESGSKVLEKRKKALAAFRDKITSDQPPRKKIKIDLHMSPVFETGDIVTIQLKTQDKHYIEESKFTEHIFREYDGKFIVLRKIDNLISYVSSVEPNVKDIWAVFQLYGKVFESCPTVEELCNIPWAETGEPNGAFVCESSMFYFKKRNYSVIGNNKENIQCAIDSYRGNVHIFFGINRPWYNAESLFLEAILK